MMSNSTQNNSTNTYLNRISGEELRPKTIEEIRAIDQKALDEFWRKPSPQFANITDVTKKVIELTASDYNTLIVSQSSGRLLTDSTWFITFI